MKLVLKHATHIDPFTATPGQAMNKYKGIRSAAFAHIDRIRFVKYLAVITSM